MAADWKLWYWPGMKGRGEYIRLVFEEAGVAYEEPAQGGGEHHSPTVCVRMRVQGGEGEHSASMALVGAAVSAFLFLHSCCKKNQYRYTVP